MNRDTETVCDLGDADVGIGQQRLGSLDVLWNGTLSKLRNSRGVERSIETQAA